MLVFAPNAPSYGHSATSTAPRRFSLPGCTVGFIDNSKPNFSLLADEIGKILKAKYGVAGTVKHSKRAPTLAASKEMMRDVIERCDLVVTGSGD